MPVLPGVARNCLPLPLAVSDPPFRTFETPGPLGGGASRRAPSPAANVVPPRMFVSRPADFCMAPPSLTSPN